MRLLIDTHLAIWWQANDPKLPREVTALIRNQAEAVFISRASLWEIAIKSSIGRLKLDIKDFSRNVELDGFQWLDIRNPHIIGVASLPSFEDHRDPFDRLLVAQSIAEPLILLTVDAKLSRYGSTVRVV